MMTKTYTLAQQGKGKANPSGGQLFGNVLLTYYSDKI